MRTAFLLSLALVTTTASDTAAVFKSGRLPTLSVASAEVGGGQVLLEVSISREGAVTGVKPLRATAAFTDRMVQSVRTWAFTPAEAEIPASRRKPGGPLTETIESKVLVAAVFRQPAAIGATLGEPTRELAESSREIPFPSSVITPTYPPGTMSPGVVLVEVLVDAKGAVSDAKIRIASKGFDDAALSTARQWTFRPARPGGANVPAVAYIVFGFPVPKG